MELIAASRIVRAQQAIAAARPYVVKMREVVHHLAEAPEAAGHPLLGTDTAESGQKVAIILITADRGLAGGYNANVIRAVERLMREHRAAGREASLVAVGRKGVNYFRYRRQPILFSLIGVSERPTYEDARNVVASVRGPLEAGEIDQVQLVYTRFLSLGSQSVDVRPMIPLVRDGAESGVSGAVSGAAGAPEGGSERTVYEFEPEPEEILGRLIPSWLEAEVLTAMLEAAASEQASRQRAMKAATDNADELIKNLRRIMNRARQDAITTEIMEIVGGAEALRQQSGRDDSGPQHDTFAPIQTSA